MSGCTCPDDDLGCLVDCPVHGVKNPSLAAMDDAIRVATEARVVAEIVSWLRDTGHEISRFSDLVDAIERGEWRKK